MRITSKGRYGLKAMMELTGHYQDKSLLKTREIAERQSIPLKYLEQIINTLKKSRLVTSVRGADGGYRLAREPEKISIYEILEALEGDLSIIDKNDASWEAEQGKFWRDMDSQIRTILDVPLTEFITAANQESDEGLMYYI